MRLLRGLEAVQSSLFNGKKRRKGRLLSVCQLWLHVCVSSVNRFVNRFVNSYDVEYRKCITYDVLLIFPQLFDKWKCYILSELCKKDDLRDLIKIHVRFEWSRDDVRSYHNCAFTWACGKGHLDVAQWLFTVFQLTVDDVRSLGNKAFRHACEYGHLDVAKWLFTVFQLTVEDAQSCDNYAFKCARHYGHQNVCNWLVSTFGESVKSDN